MGARSFFKADLKQCLRDVIRAVLARKLVALFCAFGLNVAFLCYLSGLVGFWNISFLAPTVVWYLLGGMPLLVRSFDVKEGSQHFLGYVKDAIGAAALLEFLFVANTFNLLIELVLAPIITLITMTAVLSERNPEHKQAHDFLTWVMAIIAVVIFWHSIAGIYSNPNAFFTTNTFRTFVLPIYLTIASIPFFYLLHCYSHLKDARAQIDQETFQSDELKSYAQKRFFTAFFLWPWLLRRATRQFHNLPATANGDVDNIIRDIRKYEREAKRPAHVDEQKGWSPYKAREFLAQEGILAGDYHCGFGGEEWWASSAPVDIDNQVIPNTASYYVEGVQGLVMVLKLKGHFFDDFDPKDAVSRFLTICQMLLSNGASELVAVLTDKLSSDDNFSYSDGNTTVSLRKERFPSGTGFNLIFQISKGMLSR